MVVVVVVAVEGVEVAAVVVRPRGGAKDRVGFAREARAVPAGRERGSRGGEAGRGGGQGLVRGSSGPLVLGIPPRVDMSDLIRLARTNMMVWCA